MNSSLSSKGGREIELGNQNNKENGNTLNLISNFKNINIQDIQDLLDTGIISTPSTMINPLTMDIDLSKSGSMTLFKTAIKGLPKEKQYDGNKENRRAFKSTAQEACSHFC